MLVQLNDMYHNAVVLCHLGIEAWMLNEQSDTLPPRYATTATVKRDNKDERVLGARKQCPCVRKPVSKVLRFEDCFVG